MSVVGHCVVPSKGHDLSLGLKTLSLKVVDNDDVGFVGLGTCCAVMGALRCVFGDALLHSEKRAIQDQLGDGWFHHSRRAVLGERTHDGRVDLPLRVLGNRGNAGDPVRDVLCLRIHGPLLCPIGHGTVDRTARSDR